MRLSPFVDTLLYLPAPIFSRIHVLSLAPPFFMRLAASRAKLTGTALQAVFVRARRDGAAESHNAPSFSRFLTGSKASALCIWRALAMRWTTFGDRREQRPVSVG